MQRKRIGPTRPDAVSALAEHTEWSAADHELLESLIHDSPIASETARATLARRAVEADRQCRGLDKIVRTGEDQRALTGASKEYRTLLAELGVTGKKQVEDL